MRSVEKTGEIYPHVPKDFYENLAFRQDQVEFCNWGGKGAQDLVWRLCADDALYYLNAWVWTYDPRNRRDRSDPRQRSRPVPFITYPFQDKAFLDMEDCLGVEDALVEKSRDMGATWLVISLFEHRWHFHPLYTFLVVSEKQDKVDKSGNPDSIFWKVDFVHKRQPKWLLPNILRQKLHFGNEDNGSTIDGDSTQGDVARGGRRTAIMLDEFAAVDRSEGYAMLHATQSVTDSRFFNSTPQGRANAYGDMAHLKTIRKIRFHWSEHPLKNKGLYTTDGDGKLKVLDEEHVFDEGYPFILDGKLRSPWYDRECDRTPIPTLIAQELDIDYLGSGALFFDRHLIERLVAQTVHEPFLVGELEYDQDSLTPTKFVAREKGRVKLWINPGHDGSIPEKQRFSIGADVSEGTGASNSTLSVVDRDTGVKVAEIVDSRTRAEHWGRFAVAVARWFNNAFVAWEAPGPGRDFGAAVLEAGYRSIYYKLSDNSVTPKETDIPGWWPAGDNKRRLLTEYHTALANGLFTNQSGYALRECLEFVHDGNTVTHSRALTTNDPSGARDRHGDVVIADALAWHVAKRKKVPEKDPKEEPPEGSYAWRRKLHEKQKQDAEMDGW